MSEVKKYRNIDALRSFGCLAIIAWHVKANTNFNGGGVGVLTERIIPSFDYLVYLFMIISGFGMCNGYYQKLKDGNYDLNKFYSRRYKKTVPFFSILIIVNCILEFNRENIFEGLMEITMLFGFLPNNSLSVIGVAWTLGAIFAFYIIFPFVVFLLNDKRKGIISLIVTLGITYMCQSYFMTEKFVTSNFTMRHSFLFCLPYFLSGGLIYLYRNELSATVNLHKRAVLLGCVILAVGYLLSPDEIGGFDMIVPKTLILYSAMVCAVLGEQNKWLSNRFTKFISEISMEMYLAHMVVFRVVEKLHIEKVCDDAILRYVITYFMVVLLLVVGMKLYRKCEQIVIQREIK